jgi:hypothetical protein
MEPNALNKALRGLEGNRIQRGFWRNNLTARERRRKLNENKTRLFGNASKRAANKLRREAQRNENARRHGYTIVRDRQTTGATGNFFPGNRVPSEFNMPIVQLHAEETARTTGEYPINFSAKVQGPTLKRRGGGYRKTRRNLH